MHIVWFERAEKLGNTLKSYLTLRIAGEISFLFLACPDVS